MKFDPTITIGNLVVVISMIVAVGGWLITVIIGWRDHEWRITNLETWRSGHERTTEQREEGHRLLQISVTKLTAILEGQDRRIILLEDRSEDRARRTQ